VNNLEKIDRQIQEVQTEIIDLEKRRDVALEELRQRQIQKEQLNRPSSGSIRDCGRKPDIFIQEVATSRFTYSCYPHREIRGQDT